jgi:phenylpropionate dioxygenase-like ring-hydroxylating dioxygenase large terminal subunit
MYPDRFPRNAWYVAARSQELSRQLRSRWILGEPLLLFRQLDGTPVALVDRCIHRQLPLSLGRLKDDVLQCGYHGLEFDTTSGRCVRIPGSTRVADRVKVETFPLVERDGLVWIWPGDAEQVDETLIPAYPWYADPDWPTVEGTAHVRARAQLMNENLLDLSHLTFLHPESIGSPEVAETPVKVESEGRTVRVRRDMTDVELPPFFAKVTDLPPRIDRGQDAKFLAPSFHIIDVSLSPHGSDDPAARCTQLVTHAITPETRTSAHYFWSVSRNFAIDSEDATEFVLRAVTQVFDQDIEAAEAIEHIIAAYEPSYPLELDIAFDAGPLRARRIIEEMAKREYGTAYATPEALSDASVRAAAAASTARNSTNPETPWTGAL